MSLPNLTIAEFIRYLEATVTRCRAEAKGVPVDVAHEAYKRLVVMEMELHDINLITKEYE